MLITHSINDYVIELVLVIVVVVQLCIKKSVGLMLIYEIWLLLYDIINLEQ